MNEDHDNLSSARIGGTIVGILIALFLIIIPNPNVYTSNPHYFNGKWTHIYCNHALVYMTYWKSQTCKIGPTSEHMMSYLRLLAHYPLYQITLTLIPYTYPIIAGFLILIITPKHFFNRRRLELDRFFIPIVVVGCLAALGATYYFTDNYLQAPGFCQNYDVVAVKCVISKEQPKPWTMIIPS